MAGPTGVIGGNPDLGRNGKGPPPSADAFFLPSFFAGQVSPLRALPGVATESGIVASRQRSRLQSSSGPDFNGLFRRPNGAVKSTTDFPSNVSVNYGKIQRVLQESDGMPPLDESMKYMLMIQYKDPYDADSDAHAAAAQAALASADFAPTTRNNARAINIMSKESRRYVRIPIFAWNYMMAKHSPKPVTPKDVKSAEEIWEDWNLDGVVVTETGNKSPYTGQRASAETLLNLTVHGLAQIHNMWARSGAGAPAAGTKLFIILKQVHVNDDTQYVMASDGRNYYPGQFTASGVERSKRPFQLVFWADSRYDYPPIDEIKYEDEFGVRRMGKVIKVGVMTNQTSIPEQSGERKREFATVNRNMLAVINQPSCMIHMDIRQ